MDNELKTKLLKIIKKDNNKLFCCFFGIQGKLTTIRDHLEYLDSKKKIEYDKMDEFYNELKCLTKINTELFNIMIEVIKND